ncbi:MAG: serine/threonine protein kinase, partial [Candidatus Obscuribacterales bacterium]|nr:serine/threonine protein kinase [Candidatus Obscuribacterales bacterium]
MQKLSPGDLFHERYRIVEEIGSGGMGVVYHAIQIDVNRDVALKLLKIDIISNEKDRERFIREFKILSKLSCDNIMAFYALSITPEGMPYAVCEYLEGRNLSSILQTEARLAWRRALAMASQIAHGLQFAHNLGVVHRDLKPSNIMILDKPEPDTVKLIDFGLARINEFANEQKLTRTGQLLGTPHYMSPELVMNKALDGRSDIYALACVLFELISGEKLFDAQSTLGVVQQHALEDPRAQLAKIKNYAPAALIALLEKMLAKSPDDRPSS